MSQSKYHLIRKLNIQFTQDLVNNQLFQGTIVDIPFKDKRNALNCDSIVYSSQGQPVAILNTSVRFTGSGRFSTGIIDESKASSLLDKSQIAPVYVALWFRHDDMLDLYRLDNNGVLSNSGQITEKLTPVSFENREYVIKRVIEFPFEDCWEYLYDNHQLTLCHQPKLAS